MRPSNAKKKLQLGENPSTAAARLIRDLLWSFVAQSCPDCFRCGYPLTRKTLSIDHKTPWLDSEDPSGLFYDLENISYSHSGCNYGDARRPGAWTDEELRAMPLVQRTRILSARRRARIKRIKSANKTNP